MSKRLVAMIAVSACAVLTACEPLRNGLIITDETVDVFDAVEVTANCNDVEMRMRGQRRWFGYVDRAEQLEMSFVGRKGDVRSPLGKCELRTDSRDAIFVNLKKDGRIACSTMGS